MDVDNGVYEYTDKSGIEHQVPRLRVSSLDQIQRGDHICFDRILYWHHAIVEYIDKSNGEVNAIEYNRGPPWIAIMVAVRRRYNLQEDTVYVIKHKKNLDPNSVVSRAKSSLGKPDYKLVEKTGGLFALWCRFVSMPPDYGVYRYRDKSGEKQQVPRVLASSLDQIQRGDHICFYRILYWHHAIVEYIDKSNGEIHVIEFSSTAKQFSQDNSSPPLQTKVRPKVLAKVVRGKYNLKKDTVYVIKHEKCFDADSVVLRAINRLGKDDYHLFNNNCEHFALLCKTGISSSEQVNDLKEVISKPSVPYRLLNQCKA